MVVSAKASGDLGTPPMSVQESPDQLAVELRKAREARGTSFSDLHRLTGLSRTTLHQYESGTRKPGAREIRLLCDALHVTPNQLIYGAEAPFEKKSRIHSMLEASDEDLRAARIAMLLMMLSKTERDAWITLLSESIKSRTGGGEKLDLVLSVIEAATKEVVSSLADAGEVIQAGQMATSLGQEIGDKVAATVKSKTRRKS